MPGGGPPAAHVAGEIQTAGRHPLGRVNPKFSKNKNPDPKALTPGDELELAMRSPHSAWYKNCRSVRRRGGKICESCPFRKEIERREMRTP